MKTMVYGHKTGVAGPLFIQGNLSEGLDFEAVQ
jgi:hypothetical protein